MRISRLLLFTFLSVFLLSFNKTDYLEWSEKKQLTLKDFKGKVPKYSGENVVNLSTLITYEIRQADEGIPKVTIFNYVDRNKSWIKVKKEEVLAVQQVKFDQCELAARKIRKEMAEMNKKKIKDKEEYIEVINKMAKEAYRKLDVKVMFDDQPYLLELLKKETSDSLKFYKAYAK